MQNFKRIPWLELKSIETSICGKTIFNNIDLKLFLGENTIILGPNGSGKSSLVKLINRSLYPIIKPGSYIRIFGTEDINIWKLRKSIGFLTTEIERRVRDEVLVKDLVLSGLFGSFSIWTNQKPTSDQRKTVANLMEDLNLADLNQKKFSELSDGERRKVLIARSVMNNPKVLILDEPTSGLDIKSKIQVIKLISNLCSRGTTLLMITHQVETIVSEAHRIIFLKNGNLIGDGATNEMMDSKLLSDLFDTRLDILKQGRTYQFIIK